MAFDLWASFGALFSGWFGCVVAFIFGLAAGFGISSYLKQWG